MPPAIAISVIIPTRNRADVLKRTVSVLLEQSAQLDAGVEIIVVDDGSEPSARAEFAHYLSVMGPVADPVRYFEQSPRGPAAARNYALRMAQGEIVLFLGDDIVPCSGLLAAHLRAHHEYPEPVTAVLGLADLAPEFRNTPFARWWRHWNFRYDALLTGRRKPDIGFFFANNLSLKRGFLLEHGIFDEAFPAAAYEDVELAYRLSKYGLQLVFMPEAEAYHYHRVDLATACHRMETRGRYYDLFYAKTGYPAVPKVWRWVARGPWMRRFFIRPLWLIAHKLEERVSLGPLNVLILMYFFLVGRGLQPPLEPGVDE